MKILMVCLGNICRSPIAEGVMQHLITTHNQPWIVDSAGTGSWHVGNPPHQDSIKISRTNGIDISQQRARQFKAADLEEYDLILAMDSENYRDIIALATDNNQQEKVKLLLNFSNPGKNMAVPDPYYLGGFDKVFEMIDEACNEVLKEYSKA